MTESQPVLELLQLPVEVQLAIIRALDYKSLLTFSATNKHFRDIFLQNDKQLLKHALVNFEAEHSFLAQNTSLTAGQRPTPIPCYGCNKLYVKCYFERSDWYSSSTHKGPLAFRRRCMTCKNRGKHEFTEGSGIIYRYMVYCPGCRSVTHLLPYSLCGMFEHLSDLSMVRGQWVVPENFRCTFCSARTQGPDG